MSKATVKGGCVRLTNKGQTLVKGHTLLFEGQPCLTLRRTGRGPGKCSCGLYSDEGLTSNAARKRWHAAHKEEIKNSPDYKRLYPEE
jgi:hypothetical protein